MESVNSNHLPIPRVHTCVQSNIYAIWDCDVAVWTKDLFYGDIRSVLKMYTCVMFYVTGQTPGGCPTVYVGTNIRRIPRPHAQKCGHFRQHIVYF